MHATPVPALPASTLKVGVPIDSTLVAMPNQYENQPLPMCEQPDDASTDDAIRYETESESSSSYEDSARRLSSVMSQYWKLGREEMLHIIVRTSLPP